jgi:hypothetical protein
MPRLGDFLPEGDVSIDPSTRVVPLDESDNIADEVEVDEGR